MPDPSPALAARPPVLLPGLVVEQLRRYIATSRACDRDGAHSTLVEMRGYLDHALEHYQATR